MDFALSKRHFLTFEGFPTPPTPWLESTPVDLALIANIQADNAVAYIIRACTRYGTGSIVQ